MPKRLAEEDLNESWQREARPDRDASHEPRPALRSLRRPRYFTSVKTTTTGGES